MQFIIRQFIHKFLTLKLYSLECILDDISQLNLWKASFSVEFWGVILHGQKRVYRVRNNKIIL